MSEDLAREVRDLVGEWRTMPEAAEALGVEVTRLRQFVREGKLIAVRPDPETSLRVPADFVAKGEVLKGLAGTITLLRDAGYNDLEALRWLYTPDDTLPGTPVAALLADRGTEVKRRAQAAGF